ncbi:hypothetical protein OSB04_006072 [Centaurea solstitialis]|uniref:25S rRNA (uridine-N(3))-methyltransferase BMT5-like domain-containing protein n=1 Tax=Centaurea solstitialis TaxID=347529 RepID=A0AA38WHC1_9ASTR|nr:hypothetical protein OSB04_006072 [Centaurea solstitialis]
MVVTGKSPEMMVVAGKVTGEDGDRLLTFDSRSQQRLVSGFLDNTTKMLQPCTGEVHVTHRTQYPFNEWELTKIAYQCGLVLFMCRDFNIGDYPGYTNKRGAGSKPENPSRWNRLRLSNSCHLRKACKGDGRFPNARIVAICSIFSNKVVEPIGWLVIHSGGGMQHRMDEEDI